MAGWIKIDTKISKHWLWQDAERLKWWLDILIMASWKDRKQLVGKQIVSLHRGQFIASLSFLCKRWGRSRSMVEPFLDLLQGEGMISKEVDKNISIISVLNYEKYQARDGAEVDAHLDADKTFCKSISCRKADTYSDTHLDTHLEAHLEAIREEYIDSKDNNITLSSFHSDSVSDKMSEPPFPEMHLSKFIDFFNKEMDMQNAVIPRLRTIGGLRKNHILARCREFGKEAVAEMVRKAARSDFLNGKNPKGWVATFSWMILPNNFPKVIEGNYDNKQKSFENGFSKQDNKAQRRGVEVEATSAEDYKTSF